MNNVILIGRLTRDPECKYTQGGMAVCRFSVALDRGKDRDGNDKGADFPNCVAFGKTAETIERYMDKGRQIAIQGHIQTGSYEGKNGKVYTTDIVVDRFEFIDKANRGGNETSQAYADDWHAQPVRHNDAPIDRQEHFAAVTEDIPF